MSKSLTTEQIWGRAEAVDLASKELVREIEKLRNDLEVRIDPEVLEKDCEEANGSQSEQEELSSRDEDS